MVGLTSCFNPAYHVARGRRGSTWLVGIQHSWRPAPSALGIQSAKLRTSRGVPDSQHPILGLCFQCPRFVCHSYAVTGHSAIVDRHEDAGTLRLKSGQNLTYSTSNSTLSSHPLSLFHPTSLSSSILLHIPLLSSTRLISPDDVVHADLRCYARLPRPDRFSRPVEGHPGRP